MSAGMTVSEGVIAILATGVLGSFTTMSAFAMDYVEFSDSSITSAIVYLLVTIIGKDWIGNGWISCDNGNTVIDVFRAPTVE